MDKRNIELSQYYKKLWWNLSSDLNLNIKKYNSTEKKIKEKQFNKLIDDIIEFIESYPKEQGKKVEWKERGYTYLDKIISTEEIFKLGNLNNHMKEDFIKTTKDFIKEARAFDKDITYENIGQAMRNVWIVNMLQQAFDEKLGLTKSIFAYSMLYPYTDNYLDCIEISEEEKIKFNNRFTDRLKGNLVAAVNKQEEIVYSLVQEIEKDYERDKYNDVYNSLLLIHEGQTQSLSQQEINSIPYEKDILGISIEKGGASVLVDGYLVRGEMTKAEEVFCYGYGFLLQLGDDLQDIQVDKENNHLTIMSQLAGVYKLDSIVNKLINLVVKVIDDADCFLCKDGEELKQLIKINCIYMILFAIVDNKKYFSREYINIIEEYLPFRLGYCNKLKGIIVSKFKGLKKEYHGVAIEDILLDFIE